MPTYNQGAFIVRAVSSLLAQEHTHWELIIINDGSTDYTEELLVNFKSDPRIRYCKHLTNKGLGVCLNEGMRQASYNYICYLPSDDIFYANHLSTLLATLTANNDAVLCYSGVHHSYSDTASGSYRTTSLDKIHGFALQLVQVMHRKTTCTWMERHELVTDDLDKMFWSRLSREGAFTGTGVVTCEWADHPHQRHKIIRENSAGGIYLYKRYYNVPEAIRFHSTIGNYIDETLLYKDLVKVTNQQDKLKILVVGELGYNPERLYTLEKLGHKLYGLWLEGPHCYNAVGPFPFGNIEDLSLDNWQEQVEQIKPDVIYALLNYQAVPLAHYVMRANLNIPFVWHFKEGPFFCRSFGMWKELVELYYNADGRIYINPETKSWYEQFIGDRERPYHILDGDLPLAKWFSGNRSALRSDSDGAIHTVSSGRPYGLTPEDVGELARQNIHLHFYGDYTQAFWSHWINESFALAKDHLHLHPYCKPEDWMREYSQYDAGWLHLFRSDNNGELLRCKWDDLNYPARMCTLAAAGLPMLQRNNSGHLVASERLIRKLGMGFFFNTMQELAAQLKDKAAVKQVRSNVWDNRLQFTFDEHAQDLADFFMKVIAVKEQSAQLQKTPIL
ncbi:MAG TPA: glycosyltransferase family A protein [Chitinophaga sp.]|uniref:glycosyltransferase family A protein n=1 Tax=Chitinophaga sp. TaxID=1869181 RepID=UPI002DBEE764|nr:glycosyltransferase family A protein [Chitinophaga sp.]HEU4554485.1 glycosyltransferase family A protein [Chitinophaga sp.]